MIKCSFLCMVSLLTGTLAAVETNLIKIHPADHGAWAVQSRVAEQNKVFQLKPQLKLGPQEKILPLTLLKQKDTAKQLNFQYGNPKLQWDITVAPQGELLVVSSCVLNRTDKELWLEPTLSIKLTGSQNLKRFWNGFGYTENISNKKLSRYGIKGVEEKLVAASTMPFPAVAVGGDTGSIFLGNVIFDPVSYNSCVYNPTNQVFDYALRVVLPPNGTVRFRHTIGAATVKYGFPDSIVQLYYEAFPENFTPIRGQENPYIWGNHGSYLNWWLKPVPEESRRLNVTLEWAYTPYKRAGDMLMRPELFDYKFHNPLRTVKNEFGQTINWKKMKRQDYLTWRKNIFQNYGKRYGLMFFNTVSGQWCEYDLAHQKYPDSLTRDPSVSQTLNVWSTHHDKEVRVFPMGTSFAKIFFSDMEFLAKELNLPGFSLDCFYGGAHYRGPAVEKNLPGKAWDKQGKFIDQNVALNQEVDRIHQINRKPGTELTCFINGYLKGDYVMVEASFLQNTTIKRWMPLLRWFIGPRPGCTHKHGYHFPQVVRNWRNLTQKDFKVIVPKLTDYVIMNQFKYGLTSSHLTQRGCPQLVYVQPETMELIRAGWQATTPVVLTPGMRVPYMSRYGRGVNSFIFLGNSGKWQVKGAVKFDNAELARSQAQNCLFVKKMRDQSRTINNIAANFTQVDAVLPSRIPVIYEAVAGIPAGLGNQKWEVKSHKDINQQQFELTYLAGRKFTSLFQFRNIHNFKLTEVRLNGRRVTPTAQLTLMPGSRVVAIYRSKIFKIPQQTILNFPFTDGQKKVSFAVQTGKDAASQALADRFNEYFDYCRQHKVINARSSRVKIVAPNATVAVPTVILQIGSTALPTGIAVDAAGNLTVKALDFAQGEQLIKALFAVMDKKYEYIIPFRSVMGMYGTQLTHFKMFGKSLPYKKYFEGEQK